MKISDLTGLALDWAVAKCEGVAVDYVDDKINRCLLMSMGGRFNPSTNWAQGGPIIEREKIALIYYMGTNEWLAEGPAVSEEWGTTPLIAAMRCYVASKRGDQIDIPTELMEGKP
jgi:hypothetical protein